MTILALDTTSQSASIAILREEETVLEYNFSTSDQLSAILAPTIDFLLSSTGLKLDDIDLFGVGIGPGLFTGIRVGLATIKGLLLGKEKAVVPVVTLQSLAWKLSDSHKRIITLIDARRNEIYHAAYRFRNGEIQEEFAPALSRAEDLFDRLSDNADTVFVGNGAERHRESLRDRFPSSRLYFRSHFLASETGKIAFREFRAGRVIRDMTQLHPFYLRKPDAEINRNRG